MLEELDRLARLHQAGSLTDEEFAAAKAQLLASPARGRRWRDRLPPARVLLGAAAVLLLAVSTVAYALRQTPGTDLTSPAAQSQPPPAAAAPEATTADSAVAPEPAPTDTTVDYSSAVTVTDSGWGLTNNGMFATWAAVIRNTSDAWLQTNVSVVALDSKGAPASTDTARVALPPNSSVIQAGMFQSATGVRGVRVQAAPDFAQPQALYRGDVQVSGALSGTQDGTKIVWTVTSGLDATLKQGAGFFAVFRDKAGHIVGGGFDFLPVTIGPGQTQQFATVAGQITAPDTAVMVDGWVDPTGFVAAS